MFCLHSNSQELKTSISEVTVFQNGAQVTRTGSTTLKPGISEIKVRNVSPLLRKDNIQVKGDGEFTILSVNYQVINTEQKIDEAVIKLLDSKKKELETKIEDINSKLGVLRSEEQMINSLHHLSQRENTTVDVVVKARQALQIQLTDITNKQLALKRELTNLQDNLQLTTAELTANRIPKSTSTNEIVIKVSSKKDTKADFKVMYIVNNARWYPSYDLRVKTINDPLTIEYKANISQQTGEDWTDVKLKLSTTDPSLTGQKPKIAKWNLYLNQEYRQPEIRNNYQKYTTADLTRISGKITDEYGEALPFTNIMAVGSTVGTTSDFDGNYSMNLPQGVKQITVSMIGYKSATVNVNGEINNVILQEEETKVLEAVEIVSYDVPLIDRDGSSMTVITRDQISKMPSREVKSYGNSNSNVSRGSRTKKYSASISVPLSVTANENIVSTEFTIEEKTSVNSNLKTYTVSIQEINTSAGYQYYCAPKLDRDVFLTAQLTNWESYNLLEGQANVFFEGTYVGTTLMDVRYLTDTLNISLGRDKNIVVERKKSKELNKRKVLGNEMIAYRDWDIQVRNAKSETVNIMIEDQFPVPADARIEVRREQVAGAKVNESTGIVTWDLKVPTKNTTGLKLKYAVVHPKNSFVGLD